MRILLATAAALLLAGCSSGPVTRTDEVDLQPGKFKEINLELDAGDDVTWTWTSTGGRALFDVHTHRNGQVQEPVLRIATADSGTFTAPEDGEFSLLWENKATSPIHVAYTVHIEGKVTSEYP